MHAFLLSTCMAELHQMTRIVCSQLEALSLPELKIKDEADVETWKSTTGYRDYSLFLRDLCDAYAQPDFNVENLRSGVMKRLVGVLDTLKIWVDEIPPLASSHRFGNLAFRAWGERLHQVSFRLLCDSQLFEKLV